MTRALLLVIGLLLLLPAGAAASPALEVGIADDAAMLGDPGDAAATAKQWAALGVDVARVHARWIAIAPRPNGETPPKGFDPRDANSPRYNWGPLDQAVRVLTENGIEPIVSITGSGPVWSSKEPSRHNPRWKPDPAKFGDFAFAVASRYRRVVRRWLIWNEPNQPGWLQPQFSCGVDRVCRPFAPHLYRDLFRRAAAELRAVDPGARVTIGTLAPRGGRPLTINSAMRPLTFIRAMGCVDEAWRRIRTGSCRAAQVMRASSFSYHPHPVLKSPEEPDPEPDNAALGDLARMETALDRTQAGGLLKPARGPKLPIELTELGYQTNPPDPYSGVSPSRQAAWLQWAAYLAWRDPRVVTLVQYGWRDDPVQGRNAGGWQSGLLDAAGNAKPALEAFPAPFFIDVKRGWVWGQVRPRHTREVQLQRASDGAWTTFATVRTDRRGFFARRTRLPAGRYRFLYGIRTQDPARPVLVAHSRAQVVRGDG